MNRYVLKASANAVLGAVLLFCSDVRAVTFSELAAIARSEQDAFRPIAPDQPQRLVRQCRAALSRLDEYLSEFDELERKRRQQQLQWQELRAEIQRPQPDADQLLILSKRFYAPHPGWEASPLLDARTALEQYIHLQLLVKDKTPQQLEQEYRHRLAHVARLLESQPLDHDALRSHAAWFDILDQAPGVLHGLRDAFSHPNLVFTISDRMLPNLATQFQEQIAQSQWSINTIVGRRVEGMTHFSGQINGGPRHHESQTIIELALAGTVRAPHSTAYARSFWLYSQSETAVQGTKRLVWDGRQFTAEPARVTAAPAMSLTGGEVRRPRLLRRSRIGQQIDKRLVNMALRRASRSQGQARSEVASITARTIAEQFDNSVRKRVHEVNQDVNDYYTHPLVRVGMLPESAATVSSSALSLEFRFGGLNGLAAPVPLSETLQGDVNVYIHESALPNLIQAYAGGDRWTDVFFARIQKEAVGDNAVELRIREQEERWSLTLDWLQPWSTRINKEGIRFTLHASSFSIDDSHYEGPLVVRSMFVPLLDTGPGTGWERVGDVHIDFPSRLDHASREFFHRKLSGFFLDGFFLDGLAAPAGGAWDDLSTVEPRRVELAEGWLRVAFEQTTSEHR